MKVVIRNEIRELQVTHVTLAHDLDDPEGAKLKMFFCYNCQNPIAQYQGHVCSIMPGRSAVPLPIYIKCPNCKILYSIQAIV
jgi:hypothetical protein